MNSIIGHTLSAFGYIPAVKAVVFVWICVCFHSCAHFSVLCLVIAGVKTHVCSSWAWFLGSGGHWLCFAGSATGYSAKCGHPSTFPTYTVLGKLSSEESVLFGLLLMLSFMDQKWLLLKRMLLNLKNFHLIKSFLAIVKTSETSEQKTGSAVI